MGLRQGTTTPGQSGPESNGYEEVASHYPGLEPHYQVQFSFILSTPPFWDWGILSPPPSGEDAIGAFETQHKRSFNKHSKFLVWNLFLNYNFFLEKLNL